MKEELNRIKKRQQEIAEFLKELNIFVQENVIIEGSTILEWRKYFKVEIPNEITFVTLIDLSREIAEKFQRAAYLRDKEVIQFSLLEQQKFDTYHKAYNDVRVQTQQETGKPLAAESCKIHATLAANKDEYAIATQKVIKDFWVKTCDSLTELRKLVELMGYALSADARVQRDFVVRGDGKY